MSWFGKKPEPLTVDLHSHLIPNIDDGAQSIEQSLNMITQLVSLGYQKLITTPHIHPNYPNTPEIILNGLTLLQKAIVKLDLEVELEAGAEYYVDESFIEKIKSGSKLLSFGGSYVLVESSFINKSAHFEPTMFELLSLGYQPVLAHPERYNFLEGSLDWLMELKNMGVLLQVTLGSIGGYYGSKPEKMAKLLLKKGMVDFLGSDIHREKHLPFLKKGLEQKDVQKGIRKKAFKNPHLL